MGRQVIKQPNGQFALFSSIVDDFVLINATEQEIVDHFVEEYTKDIRHKIGTIILVLENGGKPYYQFTQSFDEALETIERMHGRKQRNKRFAQCGGTEYAKEEDVPGTQETTDRNEAP